ncbi:MAG TPA: ATP-binding protein [Rhizomicrobium sp.]|jgi:signal transduction histidine kinase
MLLSLITGLLVVMLISVFAYSALDAFRREEKARTVLADVTDIRQIMGAEAQVRLELGLANWLLDAPDAARSDEIARVNRMQAASAQVIETAIAEGAGSDLGDSKSAAAALRGSDEQFRAIYPRTVTEMRRPRRQRDPRIFAAWKDITTALTRQLSAEGLLLEQEATGTDPFIDATLRMSDAAWDLRMEAGRERGYVQTAIIDNRAPSLASLEYLAQLKGMVLAHWNTIQALARRSTMPLAIKQAVARTGETYFIRQMMVRDALLRDLTQGRQVTMTGEQWVELSDRGMAGILPISTTALSLCGERALRLAADASTSFANAILLMFLSLALALGGVATIVLRVIRPLKVITLTLHNQGALHDQGASNTPVPYENHQDEIGEFARALHAFREGTHERERLKSELLEQRSAKNTAEAANRIKSTFLANMSHELRTPLNAILGFSEVLRSEMFGPLGHSRYREYADDVHKSGAHLLDLINDVLDMSKIDAGRMELRESEFPVTELVNEAVMMMRDKARDHCRLTVEMEAPAVIWADKRLIKQVLLNLLSNAIKFTPDGGQVTVRAFEDADGIALEVADTGIGMDEEELQTAFSPYGQIDSKIARQHQGTGLGLPISRSLAELHGGMLTATSSRGRGTILTLRLPATRIRRAAAQVA